MGRRAGLCLLAVLFCVRALAVNAIVSHTLYRIADAGTNEIGDAYIEIYWQVLPGGLHFSKQEDKWRTTINANIVFRNDTGVVMAQELNLRTAPASSLANAQAQNITDLHRYKLPTGKISVELKLSEPGYMGLYRYTDTFTVEKHGDIFYSGLQLLDTTYAASQENVFTKNGKQHIPLCTNFLDDEHKVMHYYAELYQSSMRGGDEYPLIQHTFISKRELESPVYGLKRVDSIGRNAVTPIYGDFSMTALASGNYYLNMVLEDKNKQRIAASSYFFQRENKNPVQALNTTQRDSAMEQVVVLDISKTFVMKFTLPQLMAILKMISPISSMVETQAIKGFQKKPDDMYMRYFIYNFWTARNKENPEAEWKRYSERVKEVNKLFTAGATMGYETDRGITYLKYGPPDERVPVENEAGTRPYEIWEYKVLGKLNQEGVFLFYRPAEMVSDYRLLHSTVNGEVRNTSWRNYLYLSNGAGGNSSNSRAEQYIRNR